jgi:hypothetical protein
MHLLFMAGLYLFVAFVAAAFLFQRFRWRRRRRLGRKDLGFYPTSTSLGNALHELQSIAEPPAKYVIAEVLDEEGEAEDDEPEGALNPRAHLLRQAARIRRGERLERLTAITGGQSVEDA